MDSNQIDQIFDLIREWVNNMPKQTPLETSVFSTFQHFVVQAMFDQDRSALCAIKQKSNPLRNRLRPCVKNIPPNLRQAMNISLASNLVDQFLFILEEEDPVSSAKHILHGEKILTILTQFKDEELNQRLICENWPDSKTVSPSTISRAVAALEEAGFLRQEGLTKGRKIHLLPKADNWQMLARFEGNAQNKVEIQYDSVPNASKKAVFDQIAIEPPVSFADTYSKDKNEMFFYDIATTDIRSFQERVMNCN